MNLKRGSALPDILFEDEYIIAVNKPAGMLAQADSTGRESLQGYVTDYLKEHNKGSNEPYCVALHRLDRPVSGIMLFAKSSVAAGRLSDDIKHRNIRKFYCALVSPAVEIDSNHQWIELQQFMVRRRDRGYIVSKDEPRCSCGFTEVQNF
jgi:23S rRNA pseudouridine1911/1915/1917 synthase